MMRSRFLLLAALAVSAASLPGCGDTFVDPFIRDQGSFSMYGVIISDGSPRPHRVRVQVVRTLPDPPVEPNDPAAQLPVQVTSQIDGGTPQRWDSTHVRLDDGSLGAVFANTFRPLPGQTIRLRTLRESDGAEASAEVTIPPEPVGTVSPTRAEGASVTQSVSWDSRVVSAEVRYYVFFPSRARFEIIAPVYEIPEDDVFTLDLVRDREFARQELIRYGEEGTSVQLSRIEVTILGTQETSWPALPDADAEAGQPGVYSNVTSGYGLVVGATRGRVAFRPDREAAIAAGFQPTY